LKATNAILEERVNILADEKNALIERLSNNEQERN